MEYIIVNKKTQILTLFYENQNLFNYDTISKLVVNYLEIAVSLGNIDIVILLLKYGCKFNKNLLYLCMNSPEMLLFMIKYAREIYPTKKKDYLMCMMLMRMEII